MLPHRNELMKLAEVSRFFYILFLIIGISFQGFGQNEKEIKTDNSAIEQKEFASDIQNRYSGSQYIYDSIQGETENFIERALIWILQKIEGIFNVKFSPATYIIIEKIIYALLIIFAVYLLVKLLMGNKAATLFSKESRATTGFNFEEEHIENIDLDKEIKNAINQNNYRLAIRFMYLKSLKSLSLKNLINWNYQKTNTDYYNEIENPNLKNSFQQISFWYDHIWYGEFALDEKGFQQAKKDFDKLDQTISYAG